LLPTLLRRRKGRAFSSLPPSLPHHCRLCVEELEPRLPPSANVAVTTDPGVQQMPSIAVDPHNANHLVTAYLDYSLLTTG
jgi:hypothetical protein